MLGLSHGSLWVLRFSLGHFRVLPADNTEVWGKNQPESFLWVLSAMWRGDPDLGMEREREKIDPKPQAASSLL